MALSSKSSSGCSWLTGARGGPLALRALSFRNPGGWGAWSIFLGRQRLAYPTLELHGWAQRQREPWRGQGALGTVLWSEHTACTWVGSCIPHSGHPWVWGISPGWPLDIISPAGLREPRVGSGETPAPLGAWWRVGLAEVFTQSRSRAGVARTLLPDPPEKQVAGESPGLSPMGTRV